jgi:LSD1 subclass zinc finger protein
LFNYIKNSVQCPGCNEYLNKVSGCNNIRCSFCNIVFNFRTFDSPSSACYKPLSIFSLIKYSPTHNYIPSIYIFPCCKFYEEDYILLKGVLFYIDEFKKKNKYPFINYINNNGFNFDDNINIRIQFMNNDIDINKYTKIIKSKVKKLIYNKTIIQILLKAYEIVEQIIWYIYYNLSDKIINKKNMIIINDLIKETNSNIIAVTNIFKYKEIPKLYHWFNFKFNIN